MAASLETLVTRFEAIATRLEKSVARIPGSGGGNDDDEDGIPLFVEEYQRIIDNDLKNVVESTKAIGLTESAELIDKAFKNNLDFVKRAPKSKKPPMREMLKFLIPGSHAIQYADSARYKGKNVKKFGDHLKAVFELISIVSWVTMSPPNGLPYQHCQSQTGSVDFNLLRVQKNNKDDLSKNWIKDMKKLAKSIEEYVKQFKKTGLTFNPKGSNFSEVSAVTTVSSKSKKEEEEEKKASPSTEKKKIGGGGGMGAVFGQLNKGLGITKGMKKVTSDMKTKNRKDRSGKVTVKKQQPKNKRKKYGPPKTKLVGGRWMVENYDDSPDVIQCNDANIKQTVYISMSDNTTIQIKPKVKSIVIDSCIKCRIFVTEVVSAIEMVNCKNCTVIIVKKAPSVQVDKSQSARIILQREAYNNNPDIYTSNVSAMNVEIPGKTDNDDPIEIPVPEQFLTKIDPNTGNATTQHVKHE